MLENSEDALNKVLARKILRARARKLGRPIIEEAQKQLAYQVVLVGLGGGRFAVESQYVREVVRLGDITPVPGLPPAFLGLANIRGELLTVLDPRALFAGQSAFSRQGGESYALLLEHEGRRMALSVEELLGVRDVDSSELARDYSGLADTLVKFTLSATVDLLIILDTGRIFAESQLAVGL